MAVRSLFPLVTRYQNLHKTLAVHCFMRWNQWRRVRFCPLIPLIPSTCPGSLVRAILELPTWLSTMYYSNLLGMKASWSVVVAVMDELPMGATTLEPWTPTKCHCHLRFWKVRRPPGLFFSVSPHLITLNGLPKDTLSKLVCSLLDTVYKGFQTSGHRWASLLKKVTITSLFH